MGRPFPGTGMATGIVIMLSQQIVDGLYDLITEIPSQTPKTFQIFLSAFKNFALCFQSWFSNANMSKHEHGSEEEGCILTTISRILSVWLRS